VTIYTVTINKGAERLALHRCAVATLQRAVDLQKTSLRSWLYTSLFHDARKNSDNQSNVLVVIWPSLAKMFGNSLASLRCRIIFFDSSAFLSLSSQLTHPQRM
jgi:hypothetical protein